MVLEPAEYIINDINRGAGARTDAFYIRSARSVVTQAQLQQIFMYNDICMTCLESTVTVQVASDT